MKVFSWLLSKIFRCSGPYLLTGICCSNISCGCWPDIDWKLVPWYRVSALILTGCWCLAIVFVLIFVETSIHEFVFAYIHFTLKGSVILLGIILSIWGSLIMLGWDVSPTLVPCVKDKHKSVSKHPYDNHFIKIKQNINPKQFSVKCHHSWELDRDI